METVSERLSGYLVQLRDGKLRHQVIDKAKVCLVDFLGVTIGGCTTPESTITRKAILEGSISHRTANYHGRPSGGATVIATETKAAPATAALCNGVAAHSLELDDTHREAIVHAGASVIPASMAVAEVVGASGLDLLQSMVAGYEAAIRASLPITLSHRDRGFHATGTCGTFGAAAAAGILLGLSKEQMVSALGLAGTQASGLTEFLAAGDMSKRLSPGRASANGITAALLAKNGFTGPRTIFEGSNGFWQAYANTIDPARALDALAERFVIEEVGFKPYSCCRYLHTSIEATLRLRREHGFSPADVDSIQVKTHRLAAEKDLKPVNVVSAQFSIPYAVAVALIDGRATTTEFTDERIHREDVQSLSSKVRTESDPELDRLFPKRWPAVVAIRLRDGRALEERIDIPKGEPENQITEEDAKAKFMSLTRRAPALTARAEKIYSVAQNIDRVPEAEELTRLLGVGPG